MGRPRTLSAEPTVKLPAEVGEVPTEELRKELQQLGAELLARFPKVSEALHVVALLYSELQRTTEAEKLWRECIELDPQHLGPYIGLATAAMELGQDESAVETLRKALAAGCSSSDAYHQLAAALTKLGRLEEAFEVSQRGLAAFPHAASNWFQLGQVQIQLERFAEAETSLRKAIDEGYAAGNVYLSLATACAGRANGTKPPGIGRNSANGKPNNRRPPSVFRRATTRH